MRAIEGDSRDPIGSRRPREGKRGTNARASVTRGKARASTRGREGRARAVRGEGGGGAARRRRGERETPRRERRARD